MYWHESIRVNDWFYIYFTENNGMAFGMEIFGKLFLTTFRIVAVALIGWYLYKIIKKGFKTGYIVCVALILTGALGNIIDSVFYGVIFNESTHSQIASFMPEGGGYSDPGIDVGYYVVDAMYDFDKAEEFIREYLQEEYNETTRFHYMAYVAIIAYYWFVWAMYRESCGADMGEALENWRDMAVKYAEYLLK